MNGYILVLLFITFWAIPGIYAFCKDWQKEFDITTRQFIFLCFVGCIAGLLGVIFIWLERKHSTRQGTF